MLKVLELFGGIGACTNALRNLLIPFKLVDYVEIDKFAVKSYNAMYGTNFEPQDITTWDKDIDVDLIMHGSPCQDFSLAGKQAGGDKNSGTRSSLMWHTVRIVEKLKPKYVIWENVKNILSKKHRHNFDEYLNKMDQLGYANYYQVLNAKDYGIPQNRERVFTVSIRNDIDKTINFKFPPNQELKLRLANLLENDVDEKYYLSDDKVEKLKFNKHVSKGNCCDIDRLYGIFDTDERQYQSGSVYNKNGLSPSISAMQGGWSQPCIEIKNGTKKGYQEAYKGDSVNLAFPNDDNRRARVNHNISNTLQCSDSMGVVVSQPLRIRKLTPKECWRLMGFSDFDFEKAEKVNSNTQLYKQAGNSIVVNVLEYIFEELFNANKKSND